jgi:hypothetical protein
VRQWPVPTARGIDGINNTGFVTGEAHPALMETLALRDFAAAFSLIPHVFAQRALRETSSYYSQPWMPAFYAAALTDANLPGFLQSLRGIADADLRGRICADVIQNLLQEQMPNRREIIEQLPVPDLWPKGVLSPWASIAYDEVRASSDPEKPANEMMARLRPDDPGRSLVLEWIIVAWADRAPTAAGRWLQTWDEDPAARNARRAYANAASRNEPVTAFALTAESGDPRSIARSAERAYLHQHKKNPAAAWEWLMNQNLPPALESLLLGQGKLE